ncbi:hypothetical protein F5Y19DRAFT_466951 [Xylariaceae sp. FL1651]|nr:hypothetical protein F5Y19DRAFT_466951 [Xylariaceae sp. FL1651]
MPTNSPVALILGAGANVGQHVGRAFAAKGYKVALASRTLKSEDSAAGQLHVQGDFTNPQDVIEIFARVKSQLGAPHVVVYNAAAATPQDAKDPLSIPLEDFSRNFVVNTTSAFVSAQQAVLAFQSLPDSASRTFIYTGNCLNDSVIPALMDCGVGKSGSAHFIHCAADAYKDKGFKFYYADERKEDGSPAYNAIDGSAHAKHYVQLAEGNSQGPWQQTFVKGVGYKKF